MRVHLIAIGGSAMHNLAISLQCNHHTVTGSDDEIYDPARSRLQKRGLLPEKEGWFPQRITPDLDAVILGMHARPDNPELAKAQALGIPIFSYPEFLYQHAQNKQRLVVAGSHGKTSTTAMIMHALQYHGRDFDYLVGAQLEGFENMVQLSEAPLIVIEGDEYLSSPIDRRPKFLHYRPHYTIITGIAWDHINVFPTFEDYVLQFELYIQQIETGGTLIHYQHDEQLQRLCAEKRPDIHYRAYEAFPAEVIDGQTYLRTENGPLAISVFGRHNLENLQAACLACESVGMGRFEFLEAIAGFQGAARRMQLLAKNETAEVYQDFAHAPSKVTATIRALKNQFPERRLIACLELHTFSSLNKAFLPHYRHTMNAADEAYVFFADHTLEMKKLPPISEAEVQEAFDHPRLQVIKNREQLVDRLMAYPWTERNLLMMSSGTFGGMDLKELAGEIVASE